MGYYSDEFFKEYGLTGSDEYNDDFEDVFSDSSKVKSRGYEDIYSDSHSRREPDRRGGRRDSDRSSRRDGGRGVYRDGRASYDRDGDHRSRSDRNTNRRPVRDDRGAPRSDEPRSGSRRPTGKKRKRRRSRLFRRTMIVLSFLAILLVLTGVIVMIVSSFGVGEVQELSSSDVGADQVVLSWEKANHADGYQVLLAKDGSDEFEAYQTISDPDTTSLTVSGLEQASSYSFSVVALRGQREGKPVLIENIFTLPEAPQITNCFSNKTGSIHVDWVGNDRATGYVVEYKKDGGEYSADTTLTVSDPAAYGADIDDLEVNAAFTVRVYTYVTADKQYNSAPSAEASVTVAAQDTEIMPQAMELETDETLDPDKPMIALTFDDGPAVEGDSGDRILDVLEQYNAKATFFMLGCNAGNCADNLKRKVDLKMEIGNHTWNHVHLGSEVTTEDVRMGSNGIYEACGQFPTAFRSPGGMTTDVITNECAAEGMPIYYWSIDTQDWSSRDADAVYHAVMDNVKDGDIILMHEIYGSTADAVEKMVPELIKQGYQLVTCHDLIALKGGTDPVPGIQYVDAFRTF